MKRKSFSLFVAALAAVTSLTCFSGCTGGGEGKYGSFLWKEYRTGGVEFQFDTTPFMTYLPSGNVRYENEIVCEQVNCTLVCDGTVTKVSTRMDVQGLMKIVNGNVVSGSAILNIYEDIGDIDNAVGQLAANAGQRVDHGNQNMSSVTLELTFAADNDGTFKIVGVGLVGGGAADVEDGEAAAPEVGEANGLSEHFHLSPPGGNANHY